MSTLKVNAIEKKDADQTLTVKDATLTGTTTLANATISAGTILPTSMGVAWVHLSTQTATASTYINFTSLLSSTYTKYMITGDNIHASGDGVSLRLQFLIASSAQTGSDYVYHLMRSDSSSNSYSGAANSGESSFRVISQIGNATGENGSLIGYLSSPSGTDNYKLFTAHSASITDLGYLQNNNISGVWRSTNAVDGFRWLIDSGTITGEFSLYGLSK